MMTCRYLLIVLLALLSGPAQALSGGDRFSVSGFGTLALAHSNLDEADFVRDIGQPKGAGKGWSARPDSLLGAQLGIELQETLDVVVQGISRYHDSGDFSPELSWAFARWTPQPGIQLRAGRLGWDVYLLSDSRYVGYAYPWVRPPVDHFGTLQLTHVDGADITFRRPIGSDLVALKLYAGRSSGRIFMGEGFAADFEVDRVYGGHVDYETGAWRFRLGYTQMEADVDFRGAVPDMIAHYFHVDADRLLTEAFGFDRFRRYSAATGFDATRPRPVSVRARSSCRRCGTPAPPVPMAGSIRDSSRQAIASTGPCPLSCSPGWIPPRGRKPIPAASDSTPGHWGPAMT
ncbi:hypothetical protein C7446_0300 [Kushneria sinocarnis]|uniref:Uncharacterized protein n=1 Tax=Kushneria sinocarnis TaxID=595502 RepID=A0A420X0V3_9GAMM|nr:hypothetical protein [Kushneria sinocarnis]RKR07488.1 hypothetical protein C7446_0300 [Kushneria sinocarnis]